MNDPGHPERNNSFYEEASEEFGVYTPAAARELSITDHQKREQQEGSQSKKSVRDEQEDGR